MTPYIEDDVIQAPVYIYRHRVDSPDAEDLDDLYAFKDFLIRRIEEDGYIPDCFYFEADYFDGYNRLLARPYQFRGIWIEPINDGDVGMHYG